MTLPAPIPFGIGNLSHPLRHDPARYAPVVTVRVTVGRLGARSSCESERDPRVSPIPQDRFLVVAQRPALPSGTISGIPLTRRDGLRLSP
jgi:hypothetical protein